MFKIEDSIKLFVFDLDDTLYKGNRLLPNAIELLQYLRQQKYKIVFFTNNSSKARFNIYNKLINLGIECTINEVYNSALLTAIYLKENNIDNVYVIGTSGLYEELVKIGIKLVGDETASNLVVGMNENFNYNEIKIAMNVLKNGGKFIACNQDSCFFTENECLPGCGAMVGAVSYASNHFPDIIVGKPSDYGLKKICEKFNVTNKNIIVVGDSFESDIKMSFYFGSKSILIGSDLTSKNENLLIVKDLESILNFVKGEVK